jgi:hypothetical protein
LRFYTIKKKSGLFGFSQEEEFDLERWIIPIQIMNPLKSNEIVMKRSQIKENVVERILQVIKFLNSHRNHVNKNIEFSISYVIGNEQQKQRNETSSLVGDFFNQMLNPVVNYYNK